MRTRATHSVQVGDRESMPTGDDRLSIETFLDDLIGRMSVEGRNEVRFIDDAKASTVAWYDRIHRAEHGVPLSRAQVDQLKGHLDAVAPSSIRKWNARQLASELIVLDDDIGRSDLSDDDMVRLRARIGDLRDDLERSGGYRAEHDRTLEEIASIIRNAPIALAERWLLRLDRFRGRHRWWL
ncbi:MAG TPA: hypothetical protein PLI21_05870 [Methanomassiliicoccaceae archaeon]|jgi:hypothetical protein|nr:hypothetical protein [Euryarchaeota archaeon]HOB38051.1 hypothetical protein [Methanomassiliicoccaceae archaeon]HOK28534.1 hypothetical protein [Methanomassiliicoccaceae archaeon]HOL07478.1 hypothetical protein [Methanomassiliicoccaceae archaeon]HPT73725.1 hypothetical protein [Methanomassiliicoccaceae archaeon]